MAKAKVVEIQVGGIEDAGNLEAACDAFMRQAKEEEIRRTKICFVIQLPNGVIKQITIRDEDDETVAYGDLGELPSMMDYAREVVNERVGASEEGLQTIIQKGNVVNRKRLEWVDANIDLYKALNNLQ